jgi:translation initiation factor IF-2
LAKIRIHDLAKELGVNSKDIIAKCLAEDVPADLVKNHMAVIPIGLAQSIKDWFSAGAGGTATAVEQTEHVYVEKVKAKAAPKKKTATKSKDGDDTDHPEAQAPAAPAPAAPSVLPAPAAPVVVKTPSHNNVTDPTDPHLIKAKKVAPAPAPAASAPAAPAPVAPAPKPAAPVAPPSSSPIKPTPGPVAPPARSGISLTPINPPPPRVAAPPAPGSDVAPSAQPARPAASGPSHTPTHTPGPSPVQPRGPLGPNISGPRQVVKPAPMNIPTRPAVVMPAGQKLEIKQKVTLAGPKVVRIEAPEQIDAPGPRRPSGTGGPPRGGRGVIGGGAGTDDDASRSPRRNKRRGPEPAAGGQSTRRRAVADELPTGNVFREQDLLEREARLNRAGGYLKQRRREARAREGTQGAGGTSEPSGKVLITAPFTIKELAAASGVKSSEIIKRLFNQGIMATANAGIDAERAQEIMMDFDIELEIQTAKTAEEEVSSVFENRTKVDERPRPAIVTIMGHVDHGKTSLLDAIRKTNVAAGEAGGITQKTSAFKVNVKVGDATKQVVFIDTPGHEAFTEMRARGANVTDVVVLVVGAPEGVMPQTVESMNHAKAAKVPIVVAINKIDSPQATDNQIQKIYGQLAEHGLSPVAWGGQTETVKTSAIKGTGIQELLEILDLQSQVLELKADFAGAARGRVVEAGRDEGRGPHAMVMVQDGELKVGDFIVVGRAFGRVRDMIDDQGKRIKVAGPATPVHISGIDEVPSAGDAFFVTDSLKKAEEAAEQRRDRDRLAQLHQPKVTLDSFFSQMKDANVKEILIVLKADVQGSVDVIKNQVEKLSTPEVKVRVLHAAVGGVQESDVLLADASKAVVVGFNVIPSGKAKTLADNKGVEIRTYQVIYDIVDDVKKAATGMLEPEIRQEVLGHAEVRQVFKVTKVGTIAGCYITDGTVQRDALIRVTRNGIVIEQDRVLEQLKRFKDDAKDVRAGMECGMKIVGYDDIKQGDVLECYKKVEVKRTL